MNHKPALTRNLTPLPIASATHPSSTQVSWSQDADEVEVVVDLPAGVKGRDISVTIKYNLIKFGLKNGHSMAEEGDENAEGSQTLLQRLFTGLNLHGRIDTDISTWSLVDGQLLINLTKRESNYWSNLYVM